MKEERHWCNKALRVKISGTPVHTPLDSLRIYLQWSWSSVDKDTPHILYVGDYNDETTDGKLVGKWN